MMIGASLTQEREKILTTGMEENHAV